MKVDLVSVQNKKLKEITLDESVFDVKPNDRVLAQYVFVYLSNQREGNANTKTKAEVRGGGKKPWAQKGTGNARAGSNRSPIWRGGGRAHGPSSDVNWSRDLNKKFKKVALKNALAKVFNAGKFSVVDKVAVEASIKDANKILESFNSPKKVTIVTENVEQNALKAFANIQNVKIMFVGEVSVYDLLNSGHLIIEEAALNQLKERSI
jgi:large subunit ribosomal protein L4